MTDEAFIGTPQTDVPTAEPRTIEQGIEEVTFMLGDRATEVLPAGQSPVTLSREDFQSRTFVGAGFAEMPEIYESSDRLLYKLTYEGGVQVIALGGRISSGNPWEVMHASLPGALDLRGQLSLAYVYDGHETITEYHPEDEPNVYEGEFGNPEVLLHFVRQSLGTSVGVAEYIPTPVQNP